jgi:hypothetical protein
MLIDRYKGEVDVNRQAGRQADQPYICGGEKYFLVSVHGLETEEY